MTILEKLLAIQTELKAPKNQMNKFGGYKYRSCEDILEAVKPLLAKYKCTVVIEDEIACIGEYHAGAFHLGGVPEALHQRGGQEV